MGLQGGALLLWRMHAGPPQEEAQPMDQDHDAGNGLSSHIDETIASLVALRQTHRKAAAPLQRLVSHLTDGLSRPRTVLVLTGLVVAWIALNLTLPLTGHVAIDPPPSFGWTARYRLCRFICCSWFLRAREMKANSSGAANC